MTLFKIIMPENVRATIFGHNWLKLFILFYFVLGVAACGLAIDWRIAVSASIFLYRT